MSLKKFFLNKLFIAAIAVPLLIDLTICIVKQVKFQFNRQFRDFNELFENLDRITDPGLSDSLPPASLSSEKYVTLPPDKKYAYVFYVSHSDYFCYAFVNFHRITSRLGGTQADLVLVVMEGLELPKIKNCHNYTACFGKKVRIIRVPSPPRLHSWVNILTKTHGILNEYLWRNSFVRSGQ